METTVTPVPRKAITSIAGGLLLMAFFTMVWTGIAQAGLQGSDHYIVLIIFSAFCIGFVMYSIRLFVASQTFPKFTTLEDEAEGKKIGKAFGIIFGIEGVAIPVVCIILSLLKLRQYILPAIAFIVALHFYPMAKIFRRKIDYYLGTWACLVTTTGIVLIHIYGEGEAFICALLGIGMACTTTAYGFNMVFAGRRLWLGNY